MARIKDPNKDMIVVRHGSTALNEKHNSPDLIRGWKDVPLDAHGKREAKQIAQKLKSENIDAIWSSDLIRAKATADEIAKAVGVKPIYTKKLRPWNMGKFTGKNAKEVLPAIKDHLRNPDKPVPDGESFNQFKDRAMDGVSEAMKKTKDENLAIVTHHRVERLLNAWDKSGQKDKIDETEFMKKGDDPGTAEMFRFKRSPFAFK